MERIIQSTVREECVWHESKNARMSKREREKEKREREREK